MSKNGRLIDAELTEVKFGRLSTAAARAWNAMVKSALRDGVSLVIAGGVGGRGSGAYRDFFTQGDMRTRPWLYGLSSYSTVNIASAGYSTHGFGNAVDIGSFPPARNLNAYGSTGAARRKWVLANAGRFGFTRTFGENDPNHFGHNGSTTAGYTTIPLENDMTDEQAHQLANIYNAIFSGGPSMSDQGKSIEQSLADINGTVSRNVQRAGADVTQIQDNADTNTMVRALLAQVAAQDAALKALASGSGADPTVIQAAAKAGASEALGSLNFAITATTK